MSRRPTPFSHSGCLQFDVFKNFERVVTNCMKFYVCSSGTLVDLRNIIGMDERRTSDYFFAKPSQGSKHGCRQVLVTSVMSVRNEKSSGRPSAYANTLEIGYVEEWQKV